MEYIYPILGFDPDPNAVLDPGDRVKVDDAPDRCVLCFFQDVLQEFQREKTPAVIAEWKIETSSHAFMETEVAGKRLGVMHPGVGGPVAALLLENLIACGCKKFIACGGAGVLTGGIPLGHIIIPTSAIRDEGASYHYMPPTQEAAADTEAVAVIEQVLLKRGKPYTLGKTWTTDAIYRETRGKIQTRRKQGCLTVEMEAATFFAVARFRGVQFGQILYAGDDLSGEEWDRRDWMEQPEIRKDLFELAIEACLAL
jgi:uridine phosphorylase